MVPLARGTLGLCVFVLCFCHVEWSRDISRTPLLIRDSSIPLGMTSVERCRIGVSRESPPSRVGTPDQAANVVARLSAKLYFSTVPSAIPYTRAVRFRKA
jgi:hypothetical protein